MEKEKLERINQRLREMIKNESEAESAVKPVVVAEAAASQNPGDPKRSVQVIRRRKGSPDKHIFQ